MFLPLRHLLVATFNETRAPTFRNCVAEQGIYIPDSSKTCENSRSHSSVFAFEKEPKILTFHSVFTSNRPLGDYFQWNVCNYFQKTDAWTKYSEDKLIKNILNFFARTPPILLQKNNLQIQIFTVFLPLREPLVVTFNETREPTSRNNVAEQRIVISNWSKTF